MGELRFDGRVAVVTGAGRGIGRAHSLLLASRGAKVVVNDLGVETDGTGASSGPAEEVIAEIRAAGGEAIADAHTVATQDGAEAIIATALETFGRLDILIHNAGLVFVDFDTLLDVHLRASHWLCEAAWPTMEAQHYGKVLLTVSNAGLYGFNLGPSYTPMQSYGAAKGGMYGLMRNLAHRGSTTGIQVNALAPSAESRMEKDHASHDESHDDRITEAAEVGLPSRPPELVARAAAWLLHEDCQVSGEVIAASCGRVTRIFMAETMGYWNPDLTPELVRDHFAQIRDEHGYVVPADVIECPHVQAAFGHFEGAATS